MYSCGPLDTDEQILNDQLDAIYNNAVPILDIARKTCRKRWSIETIGEWESGRSVIAARHDDDDDDQLYEIDQFICRKIDLALNNLQVLIYH